MHLTKLGRFLWLEEREEREREMELTWPLLMSSILVWLVVYFMAVIKPVMSKFEEGEK